MKTQDACRRIAAAGYEFYYCYSTGNKGDPDNWSAEACVPTDKALFLRTTGATRSEALDALVDVCEAHASDRQEAPDATAP